MPDRSPLRVDTFLPYMRDVSQCETSLNELSLLWRMIESSAKMNCPTEARTILPSMAATRAGFQRLERDMVHSLVGEKTGNVLDAIGTQAQYVIDIVVRNLYERTADVGFLATDRVLCEFVAAPTRHTGEVDAIRERLRSYREKYTVYLDAMLLDTEGNVLVQTDPSHATEGSVDPLIAATLQSDTHVETFRATDLRPGAGPCLVYSRRMLHPTLGTPVGLLCLFFDFDRELQGIFQAHRDPEGRSNMLLLDGDGRVIASADGHWIARGATVPLNPDGQPRPMLCAGREYLVATRATQGYQGYPGPSGWRGQVMVPIELAFQQDGSGLLDRLDPEMAAGLLTHARRFSPPLHEVIMATETIRRVVWNGQVVTAGQRDELQRLKAILDQISETGARSNALFTQSIRELYQTVLQSNLQQVAFSARLLVDLLDRNLYERANDCRWWALAPELAAALTDPAATDTATQTLRCIHSLYTVYSRLVVYNRQGQIVAESARPGHAALSGHSVDRDDLARVLELGTEQHYHASAFAPSPLADGHASYVYHAAVRHPQQAQQVLGGIGIAFDAHAELAAILNGAIEARPGAQAYFLERSGRIIASTDPNRPVGALLALDADLLALAKGDCATRVTVWDGQYQALACSVSSGYREFKVSDGYRADVLAVVAAPLGPVVPGAGRAGPAEAADWDSAQPPGGGLEHASFYLGGQLLAVPALHALEALPAEGLAAAPQGGHPARIGILPPQGQDGQARFHWVYDLGTLLQGQPSARRAHQQVVVLRQGEQRLGVLVDELHGVPEFQPQDLMPSPFGMGSGQGLVSQFAKAAQGRVLVGVLDVPALFRALA
jgi:chemotaxis signal transduction protein